MIKSIVQIVALILLSSLPVFGKDLYKPKGNYYIKISISLLRNVSYHCSKNLKKCAATKIILGEVQEPNVRKGPRGYIVNPASILCRDLGAKAEIYSDAENNQIDFCVFEDGSGFSAHHLLRTLK